MLTTQDLRGVMAMMPAFATANAAELDARQTIDVDNLTAGVDRIIGDGIDLIATTGSFGEFHTLLPGELETLIEATVSAVAGRVPLFIGCTGINSREAVDKIEAVVGSGADGILLGAPFYFPSTVENALRFFTEVADRFPPLAVMIYHNPVLHRLTLPPGVFRVLTEHPNIVAMKDSHRDTLGFQALDEVVRGRMSVFVLQTQYHPYAGLGAAGCWSIDAWMGPRPVLALRDAIAAGDAGRARRITLDLARVGLAGADLQWRETAAKLAVAAAGYCDPGPLRPPFVDIPPEELDNARVRAKTWAELCATYSA